MKLALDDWRGKSAPREFVITTALLPDKEFYFESIDVDFHTLVDAFLKCKLDGDLIQIAFPRLYRHRPLQILPLYHELGHFVDIQNQVTELSLLRFPPMANPQIPPKLTAGGLSLPGQLQMDIHRSHRREMFADLFAASYAGRAYVAALDDIAHGHPPSESHPATADRLRLIEAFLAGSRTPVFDMFSEVLNARGMPEFKLRYTEPSVFESFGNIRPHRLSDDSEVHGVLSGAIEFTRSLGSTTRPEAWKGLTESEAERIVNDLIEKSIRNRMIEKGWSSGAAP